MPRIPQYSEGRGNISLSGRLQPMSGQTIAAMGEPARAMADFAQTTGQAIGSYIEVNRRIQEKRDTDEARVWVLERRNSILAGSATAQQDIADNMDPSSFLKDKGTPGAPDPQSFTSKSLAWFDEALSTDYYVPPNKVAEQMWREETARLRGDYTLRSIEYQSKARSQYIQNSMESTLNDSAARVLRDPSQLMNELNAWEGLLSTPDIPGTEDFEGYYGSLSKQYLTSFSDIAKTTITDSALLGLTKQDPLAAIKYIRSGSLPTYSIKPERLNSLLSQAESNVRIDLSSAKSKAVTEISNHIAAIANGGEGNAIFNTEVNFESYLNTQFRGQFDDKDLQQYLPHVATTIDETVQAFKDTYLPKLKQARASSQIMAAVRNAPEQDILKMQQAIVALSKETVTQEDVEHLKTAFKIARQETDITEGKQDFISEANLNELVSLVEGMSTVGRTEFINAVFPQIEQLVNTRRSDPVEYFMQQQDFKSAVDLNMKSGFDPVQARFSALDEQYNIADIPEADRQYLTKEEVSQTVASIVDQNQTADDLIAKITNLEEQYGDYYESIWTQLQRKDPSLDSRYAFIASQLNSDNMARMMAQALITTDEAIKDMFAENRQDGVTYSQVISQARSEFTDKIIKANAAGLPERLNQLAPIRKMLDKVVALAVISGQASGKELDDLIPDLLNQFDANFYVQEEGDRISAMITSEHQDSNGGFLINSKAQLESNAKEMFNSRADFERAVSQVLDDEFTELSAPSSYQLSVLGTGDRANTEYDIYVNHLVESGYLAMNDEGTAFIVVTPHFGGAVNTPVMVRGINENGAVSEKPLEIPFDYLTRNPKPVDVDEMTPIGINAVNVVRMNQATGEQSAFGGGFDEDVKLQVERVKEAATRSNAYERSKEKKAKEKLARGAFSPYEAQDVISTLVRQREQDIDQFNNLKGNLQELFVPGTVQDVKDVTQTVLELDNRTYEKETIPTRFKVVSTKEGEAVKSIGKGVVTYKGWMRGIGNLLMISHPGGYMSVISPVVTSLKEGDMITGNQTLGYVGDVNLYHPWDGDQRGLRVELQKDGKAVDLKDWMK